MIIECKEENLNFTVQKSGKPCPPQGSCVASPATGKLTAKPVHRRSKSAVEFSEEWRPGFHPNWSTFSKLLFSILQKHQQHKKKRLRHCSKLRRSRKHDSGRIPFHVILNWLLTQKQRALAEQLVKCESDSSVSVYVNFQFWLLYCDYITIWVKACKKSLQYLYNFLSPEHTHTSNIFKLIFCKFSTPGFTSPKGFHSLYVKGVLTGRS